MRIEHIADLELFMTISRTLSLSAAGRELGLSPAVVSKRLLRLEDQLKLPLFYRNTRQLSLTSHGERLKPYAEQVLSLLQEAEALLVDPLLMTGRLRLTTSVAFGKKYVLPLMETFMERFPSVQVQLHLDDQTLPLIEQGFDLAIRFGELSDSRLVAQRLFTGQRLVCASPEYLAFAGTPSEPQDLLKHRCLLLNQQDQWRFQKGEQLREVKVPATLSLNSGEVLKEMAVAGHGLVKLSLWHLYDEIADGRLVPVLSDWEVTPPLTAWLVHPGSQSQSSAAHYFSLNLLEGLSQLSKLKIPKPSKQARKSKAPKSLPFFQKKQTEEEEMHEALERTLNEEWVSRPRKSAPEKQT